MERWRLISGALLFALVVYAVFAVNTIIREVGSLRQLNSSLESTTPENIGGLIEEVRALSPNQVAYQQDILLYSLLLQDALYHPEHSADKLREVLEVGPGLYQRYPGAREHIGTEMAFAFYYAGLPALVPDWNQLVLIDEPHVRPRAKLFELAALLSMDREDLARQLIEQELAATGGSKRTRLFAFLGYVVLEDFEAAGGIEVDPLMISQMDLNQRGAWAAYLLNRRDYEKAYEQYKQLNQQPEEYPERGFDQALARAALKGLADLEVEVLLEQAAKSSRYPRSVAGQQALICDALIEVSGDPDWTAQLTRLYFANRQDYWVAAAVFEASLTYQSENIEFPDPGDALLSDAVTVAARRCLALATSEYQLQWANLLMARALAYAALNPIQPKLKAENSNGPEGADLSSVPVEFGKSPEVLLEQAVLYFRQAVGDPNSPDPVASERLPEYDYFLLDPVVKQARSAYPQFDTAIHEAVIWFLEGRAREYRSVTNEYKWLTGDPNVRVAAEQPPAGPEIQQ